MAAFVVGLAIAAPRPVPALAQDGQAAASDAPVPAEPQAVVTDPAGPSDKDQTDAVAEKPTLDQPAAVTTAGIEKRSEKGAAASAEPLDTASDADADAVDAASGGPKSHPDAADHTGPDQSSTDRAGPDHGAADKAAAGPEPARVDAQLARWITRTSDNNRRPFVIVDKVAASIFVFNADGLLLGSAPVLVGLARGDDSAAGVGDRQLSAIGPDDRTTPAGRFVAGFGAATGHKHTVLWVDYADAISLHPVVTSNPSEHRLTRIKSASPEDHRISYGCINVPASFYGKVVMKAFAGGAGVVYILPDTRPLDEVFPAFAASVEASAVADQSVRSPDDAPSSPDEADRPLATQGAAAVADADPPGAQPAEAAAQDPQPAPAARKTSPARRHHHPHRTT